jgi:ribosomal protein L31E
VEEFGLGPTELANMLVAEITTDQRKAWSDGSAEDWANESFNMAREFVARHNMTSIVRAGENSPETPIVLQTSVIDEVKRVIAHRLKMAGVRLAWLLNRAFEN